jgi:hypothetical protein
MSGDDIPYQLRPRKFVDRQLFLELLARLVVPFGIEKYAYASMGGRHMVDHFAVYNRFGIDALFSFDLDPNTVKRQRFNRPLGSALCVEMPSSQLPSKLDQILSKFPKKTNLIVWLDYTSADRRAQLQEIVETLVRLKPGDVFRATMNADIRSIGNAENWKKDGAANPGEWRLAKLKDQVLEFLPTDLTGVTKDNFPNSVVATIQMAVAKAAGQMAGIYFHPILLTSYADGSPMVTAACAVSDTEDRVIALPQCFRRWKFACKSWTDVMHIDVPTLSSRESARLSSKLHRGPSAMSAALRFLLGADEVESLKALSSYRELHRYYPTFRNVDD